MRPSRPILDSRAILDHFPIPVMVLHAESRKVLLINRKFTSLLGYTAESMAYEQDWWPLAFPDSSYRGHACREWDRRVRHARLNKVDMEPLEVMTTCANGSQCHLRMHYALMDDQEVITLVDISDQKILLRQYEDLATTDTLTGLANRRAFFIQLERSLALASRHKRPLSVILADIDHFKQVNDLHGHQAGDGVLSHFASILSRGLRASDLAARIGGEEFALLLPETGRSGAYAMAERLRKDVEANVYSKGGLQIPITVSFGLACLHTPGKGRISCDDLVRLADEALYMAKHGGRNQVCMKEPGAL